jgi:hypothetical protein
MAAYYKVDVVLNSQAVSVGLPSPQSVRVTLPLVGPQGPAGPKGDKGDPGDVAGAVAWDNVTDKPTTFPPEAHAASHEQDGSDAINVNFLTSVLGNNNLGEDITAIDSILDGLGTAATSDAGDFAAAVHGHVAADVSDFAAAAAAAAPVASVAGRTGAVTLAKADVGLGNVDNTSDTNKPISSATQSALDGKAATSHTHTASQVTDFNTAAAAAAPVQSVNGNTGTVTVAVPSASTATPQALGTAAAGTSADFARADHVHPKPSPADLGAVASDTTGITGASAITNIVAISQADYDDIVSPDASTLFLITDP